MSPFSPGPLRNQPKPSFPPPPDSSPGLEQQAYPVAIQDKTERPHRQEGEDRSLVRGSHQGVFDSFLFPPPAAPTKAEVWAQGRQRGCEVANLPHPQAHVVNQKKELNHEIKTLSEQEQVLREHMSTGRGASHMGVCQGSGE